MNRYVTLALFIALTLGGGTLIGVYNIPGDWYASLVKPSFNPPNWVFGPAWTTLYIMIAIAGWRLWENHRGSTSMKIWWAAIVVNFIWSPVFFGMQNPVLALGIIIAMLILIYAFIAKTWNLDRISAWLFVPYAAWVSFATLLNASIVVLN
ncbi:MAG: TspO/MBR family protein [Rhizobiaceae bacterium]